MWYEWFFQGIGTEILILIIGLMIGGVGGYRIGIKKNGLQKQIAKDEVKQKQELEMEINDNSEGDGINGNLQQVQKAGSKAEQSQVGKIRR